MHGAEGDSNPTGLQGARRGSLHLAPRTQPGTVFGVFLSTAKFWQEWRKKTISFTHRSSFPVTSGLWRARSCEQSRPTAARAAGCRRACETGPGAEHPRLRGALPPGPGRAGGRAAGSAARKDGVCLSRDRGAAGAAAPHRAAARLSQGPAGGAAMAADAPATLPVQLVEQPRWVGGTLPSAPAPQRETTAATELRKPAAIYPGAGGRAVCRRAGEVGGQVGRSVSKPLAWGVRGFWPAILWFASTQTAWRLRFVWPREHPRRSHVGLGVLWFPRRQAGVGAGSLLPQGRALGTGPSCPFSAKRDRLLPRRPCCLPHTAPVAGGE